MDWTPERGPQGVADAEAPLYGRLRTETEPPQPPFGGIVVSAVDPETNRRVALKLVRGPLGRDPGVRRAARADAIAQSWLDHPRIAGVLEHGPLDDGFYLVMTWLEGRSLDQLLGEGRMDPDAALRVARDVAEAVTVAAANGVVHRDLTPAKVVVSGDGRAALGDLGAGRRRPLDPVPVPSFPYAAPELFRGEAPSPAAHEYALAAMLFHALTGDAPPSAATRSGRRDAAAPKASARRRGLPAALDGVLARGMAIDAGERHGSPAALVDAATAVLRPASSAPPRAAAVDDDDESSEGVYDWSEDAVVPGTRRVAWIAAAVIAGGAALAGGLLAGRDVKDPPPRVAPGVVGTSELQLVRPSGWRAADPPPAVPWLDPVEQVSMAPGDGRDGTAIAAGMTEPGADGLLPDALVGRLPAPPGRGTPVRLGRLEALRYPGLSARGVAGSPLTLYAVPTNTGTATVACLGAAARDAVCGRTAASLRLRGPRARPLQPPSARYGRAVERVFASLDRARATALDDLAAAPNRPAQARVAGGLAEAYRQAEERMRRAPDRRLVAAGNARILSALTAAAGAYADLSASAARGDELGYADARGRARGADAAVQQALDRLGDEGYRIR